MRATLERRKQSSSFAGARFCPALVMAALARMKKKRSCERRTPPLFLSEGSVSEKKVSWLELTLAVLVLGTCLAFALPKEAQARRLDRRSHVKFVPQFARRYNLKCSACHTIAPVLNEQGYLFKRLGYRLPPGLEEGKPAPTIAQLVAKEPKWALTNNAALVVTDLSYSAERSKQEGESAVSTSSLQVASWNAYIGGWLPNTNFWYYSEADIVSGGATNFDLSNAYFGYTGGNARSSWYVAGGREHLQIGTGTRAAQVYSLLPSAPLLFESAGPTNFVFDQAPVGIDVGYTFASSNYKHVLAATVKVMNGDNADGSEILGPSNRNSKDVWLDLDWWYAPESGVTLLGYYGTKDNAQTDSAGNAFTFSPHIRRQGIFANYKFFSKIDLLGGYLHNSDDWQVAEGGALGRYIGNDFYGAVDYYITSDLAVSARYDLLQHEITGPTGLGPQSTRNWGIGVSKTFTPLGNVIGRIAYGYLYGRDPIAAAKSTDRFFQADIGFNF